MGGGILCTIYTANAGSIIGHILIIRPLLMRIPLLQIDLTRALTFFLLSEKN